MHSIRKNLAWLLASIACVLGLAAHAHAQAINTAPLSGQVKTETGQTLAGAKVKITHEPTSTVTWSTVNADGSFVSRGLRPGGPYSVEAEAAGYAPAQLKDVYLDVEAGANVNIVLQSSEVVQMEKYSVTADSAGHLFDPTLTDKGTFLTNRDIRNTVVGDRSIISLAARDSRISYNADPNYRAISVSGINNRYNSIQIDGVSVSDPFGLNSNNTAAERNVIPLDALEALVISTSPYDVRKGGFVGASVNAITKSGGNDFSGSVYYTFRNQELVGEHLDSQRKPINNFKEQTYGLTLGGPIIPKKLFFFVSLEKVDEDRMPVSVAASPSKTDMDKIISDANLLGFNIGNATPPSGNKLKDTSALAKVDWQINENHRLSAVYKYTNSERPSFPGYSSKTAQENYFSFDSSWYDQDISNKSLSAQLVSRWSDKLHTELAVSYSKYHSEPKNNTRQPYVTIQNVPVVMANSSTSAASVSFGTELSRHANILDTKTATTEFFATYQLSEKHALHAGVQYQHLDVFNKYVQNAYGTYTFASLDEFNTVALENTGTTHNYYQYTYNRIVPGINPAAEFGAGSAGVFVRDEWRVARNFNVDMGVRVDTALVDDKVPYNADFKQAFGVRNDYTYDGKALLQPRIGFNWQPKINDGKRRTTIRGGGGLFAGDMPHVWLSNSFSNTGFNYESYTFGTKPGGQAPKVESNPDKQFYDTAAASKKQTVAFMMPGFKLPSRWKANIAIERELGLWGMVASVEYEWSKVNEDVRFVNMNLAQTTDAGNAPIFGPDGRVMYWKAFDPATGNPYDPADPLNPKPSTSMKLVNSTFTDRIIGVTNTNKGGTSVFTVALNRPAKKDGWSWGAAYTYTDAEEVAYGSSSVAGSCWNYRASINPNEENLHTAQLEIRHRIVASVTREMNLFSIGRTSFTLMYNGHSGLPFSLTASNDVNGDGNSSTSYLNDLMYIPKQGDARFVFATNADRENFYKIVKRYGLAEGASAGVNSIRYPWVHQFNFRIEQEVKLPYWRHALTLAMDILNAGNLLNNKWGVIHGNNQFFYNNEPMAKMEYNDNSKTYKISSVSANLANGVFAPALGAGEPAATRWSILFSAKYKF